MSMYQKKAPYRIEAKQGVTLQICVCGQTHTPPRCDCSHPTQADPFEHTPAHDEKLEICGCGNTSAPPWCDGSHSRCEP